MSQFGSEPVRDPAGLGFDKARLARLKQWMQRYADTGRWPGGAVLIARHGELAYFDCAGYADVEAKRPDRESRLRTSGYRRASDQSISSC